TRWPSARLPPRPAKATRRTRHEDNQHARLRPERPQGEGRPRNEAGRAQRDGGEDEEARGDDSPRRLTNQQPPARAWKTPTMTAEGRARRGKLSLVSWRRVAPR